jgi:hypothetical protein
MIKIISIEVRDLIVMFGRSAHMTAEMERSLTLGWDHESLYRINFSY